MLRWAAVFILR